jgi:hypothetical protein
VFPDPFEKGMMKSYTNLRDSDAFAELKRSATYKELRENSLAMSKKTGLAYKKFIQSNSVHREELAYSIFNEPPRMFDYSRENV